MSLQVGVYLFFDMKTYTEFTLVFMPARREEAYLVDFVHKNVLYRTCGHNKLCPYRSCLQVNKSYTELT